jgi:hypothetical protein
MMIRAALLALTAVAFLSFSAAPQNSRADHPAKENHKTKNNGNADAISEDELKAYLYFLASDQLEGRNFPSRGFDTAALYVASHLAEWGVKPIGSAGGTNGPLQPYFMPIELESRQIVPEESKATFTIAPPAPPPGTQAAAAQPMTFEYAKDWLLGMPGQIAAIPAAGFDISGNIVYAGNGWVIHKINADPYKGIDVHGKIIVIAGMQQEVNPAELGEACRDYFTPQQYAARNGALAVITIASSPNAAFINRPGTTNPGSGVSPNGPPFFVKASQQASACPSAPILTAGLGLTNALFLYERHNGAQIFYTADKNAAGYSADRANNAAAKSTDPEPFALMDRKTLQLHLTVRTQPGHGENVIGIVEGSDPALKNEYVVLSAHLDHLGLGAPQPNGHAVFNGADDDGSGSAGLLAAAHAYAIGAANGMRPKRSILFLWNGGEEKGYSGSRYFVQFPPIDLKNVVALLHMDMIGRTKNPNSVDSDKTHLLVDRGEILLVGPNISSDDLERTVETVNGDYQKLKLNHFYDVTHPDATHDNLGPLTYGQRLFSRSDQYNFALMGIPVAYFTTGLHADYHHPTDTPEKIDYQELQMVARTVAAIGWNLGNATGRPKLNVTLPDDLKRAMESVEKQGWGKVTPLLAPLPGMPY